MRRHFQVAVLAAICSPAALAQLQLFQVGGTTETPVGAVFAFGSIDAGDSGSPSACAISATLPPRSPTSTVLGPGFMLVAPTVPATLASGATFESVVGLQPAVAAAYSAVLQVLSVSVLLTGTAAPVLTFEVVGAAGTHPLTGPVNFGAVLLGARVTVRFVVLKQMAQALPYRHFRFRS